MAQDKKQQLHFWFSQKQWDCIERVVAKAYHPGKLKARIDGKDLQYSECTKVDEDCPADREPKYGGKWNDVEYLGVGEIVRAGSKL